MLERDFNHPIEILGKKLRENMSWLKDKAKASTSSAKELVGTRH